MYPWMPTRLVFQGDDAAGRSVLDGPGDGGLAPGHQLPFARLHRDEIDGESVGHRLAHIESAFARDESDRPALAGKAADPAQLPPAGGAVEKEVSGGHALVDPRGDPQLAVLVGQERRSGQRAARDVRLEAGV